MIKKSKYRCETCKHLKFDEEYFNLYDVKYYECDLSPEWMKSEYYRDDKTLMDSRCSYLWRDLERLGCASHSDLDGVI